MTNAIVPQTEGARVLVVSISSTSEEVRDVELDSTWSQPLNMFPLVPLPKKCVTMNGCGVGFRVFNVSISSTSEEVRDGIVK